MMNKYFWLGILAIVLVFGTTVVGCDVDSTNGNESLVGKWYGSSGDILEFTSGDTVKYYMNSSTSSFSEGTYSISGNVVTTNILTPYTYELSGNTLTLVSGQFASIGYVFTKETGKQPDSGNNESETNWWKWVSTSSNGNFYSSAQVSISPNADDSGCDVTVTGSANSTSYSWASQIGYDYTATVGSKYTVSWKWKANNKTFGNVSIRYAQRNDYVDQDELFLGSWESRLTIPTTEETKTYEFTMPNNHFMNFVFMIGADTGSFTIWDFKVEKQ
jgi:hypothetical protein